MKYDLIIVGGGPGGYPAAIKAAEAGLKVAIIDKSGKLGGTCLSVGCIPSKTLLHFTERLVEANHAPLHGAELDFAALQSYREKVIGDLQKALASLFKQLKITVIEGVAEFVDARSLKVGAEIFEAENIVLATGSEAISLPFLPVDEKTVLTSTGALSLQKLPQSLVVIGAGVIGVELASYFQRLGVKVHVVEMLASVCTGIDVDLSRALEKTLIKQGLQFSLSTEVTRAEIKEDSVRLFLRAADGTESIVEAEKVLVAIGRRPNSRALLLEKAGIQPLRSGHIPVDRNLKAAANIYAIGDLIQGPMLAHRAEAEGRALGSFFGGNPFQAVNYFALPNVIYTAPEVASVGLTEAELKAMNHAFVVTKSSFQGNPRAMASQLNEGFVKLLWDKENHTLLGMHIIGPTASELIAVGMIAIAEKMTRAKLAVLPFAHPTLSEAIKDAAM